MSEDTQGEIEQILLTLRQCIDNLASILDKQNSGSVVLQGKAKGRRWVSVGCPDKLPGCCVMHGYYEEE